MNPRDLVKDTLQFASPPRIPRQLWDLPWAADHYPQELAAIKRQYPDDIIGAPACLAKPLKTSGEQYQAGYYVDEWGCRFRNIQPGLIGEVKEPLLKDYATLDLLRMRTPDELLSVDVEQVNAFCRSTDRFVLAGVCPNPFERIQYIRTPENIYLDLIDNRLGVTALLDKVHQFYLKVLELWVKTDVDAITWNDDRKVAAFVSEKDPAVLSFSKNVAAVVKSRGNGALSLNLQTALAMHQALQLFGLSYVPDPKSPYAESSKKKDVVDFLQFPRQTFEYRSGDCDDLTILFCSLLEAVGIETAAITIPGHIYMAFDIDASPAEVRRSYLHPDDFIFMADKSWVPVEITERTEGFLRAWQEGAQEWRENVSRASAGKATDFSTSRPGRTSRLPKPMPCHRPACR